MPRVSDDGPLAPETHCVGGPRAGADVVRCDEHRAQQRRGGI